MHGPRQPAALAAWRNLLFAVLALLSISLATQTRAALSFYVEPNNPWPGGWYNAAVADMQTVVNEYNSYGDFGNGSIYVYYNAGIPTAQSGYGGYGGSIGVGGTYPDVRVLLHESSHWLGTGTYSANWYGPNASALIQQFDGVGAVLNGDTQHYWPYGENYGSESSPINDARHVAMVYGLREDFGIGSTARPSAATTAVLTASDPAGTSAFNYPVWAGNVAGEARHFAQGGTAYSTGSFDLRTPNGYPSWTFAGNSLTVNTGGRLLFNGWGTTGLVTINNLMLSGGTVRHDQASIDLFQLAGKVTLVANTTSKFDAGNGNIKVLADVGGGGSLTKIGGNSLALAGTNTYTGSTIISGGTLVLAGHDSINASSGITVNGVGAKLLQTSSVPVTTPISLTNGTLDGVGSVGAVSVANNPGSIVTNGNGGTGALTLSSLAFAGAGTDTVRIAGGTSFGAPGQSVTGALTTPGVAGAVTLNVNAQGLVDGTYNLIQYGSLAGGGAAGFKLGATASLGNHQTATLATSGSNLTLTVGGDLDQFTGVDGNVWRVGSTGANHNFKLSNAGSSIDYADNDAVLFNDSVASGTLNLATNVAPAWTTFSNSSVPYTVSSSAGFSIGGSGGITKNGGGALTLATSNTYTGGTVVNGGTLNLGVGGSVGTIRGALTINPGAMVNLNANDALGYGSTATAVTQISINGGTLNNAVNGNNSLAASWTLNGGSMTSTGGGTFHIDAGSGNSIASLANAAPSVISANVAIRGANSALPIDVADGAAATDLLISGAILNSPYDAGSNAVVKSGGGTLVLSGANTYGGGTTVNGGTVSIAADNNLGAGGSPIALNGGTLTTTGYIYNSHPYTIGAAGGTMNVTTSGQYFFNSFNQLQGSGPLTLKGTGTLTPGVGNLRLNQGNSYSGVLTLQQGGILEYGASGAIDPAARLIVANEGEVAVQGGAATSLPNAITVSGGTNSVLSFENGGQGVFSGPITQNGNLTVGLRNWYDYNAVQNGTISGVISGTGSLTVNSGNGTGGVLTLSGANSFTGNLTVTNATVAATFGPNDVNANGRAFGALGNEQFGSRTIIINPRGTILFATGNVLGGGGSSAVQAPALRFVVNAGGLLRTAAGNVGGAGGGDANIFGPLTLNGGTLTTGNGYNADYQAAILLKDVTVGGSTPSTIGTDAINAIANGVMLGDSSNGTHTITFNVSDVTGDAVPDLVVSARLTNSAGSASNPAAIGALTKAGLGTMALSGTNVYTGPTRVTGGKLLINGNSSASTGAVSVAAGASLGGVGTVGGPVTLSGGGNVSPGAGVGTLTAPSLTWNSDDLTAGAVYELSSTASGPSDNLALTTLIKGTGTRFLFAFTGGVVGQTYPLIGFTNNTGPNGAFVPGDFGIASTSASYTGVFSVTGNNVEFTLLSTPEPASLAFLAPAALVMAARRRRSAYLHKK